MRLLFKCAAQQVTQTKEIVVFCVLMISSLCCSVALNVVSASREALEKIVKSKGVADALPRV
jgi:hypothetical protein